MWRRDMRSRNCCLAANPLFHLSLFPNQDRFAATSGKCCRAFSMCLIPLVCGPSQFFTTAHLIEDNVSGGLPGERLGRIVPACKPLIDGPFQCLHRVESAAP